MGTTIMCTLQAEHKKKIKIWQRELEGNQESPRREKPHLVRNSGMASCKRQHLI
jgi:hypothetical protein